MSSDLRKLAADFRKGRRNTPRDVKATINRGALGIKKDAARRVKSRVGNKAPALPYAINYDGYGGGSVYGVEIGFDKNRNMGALGNLIEFGAPARNTDEGRELEKARDREMPTILKYIREAADPLG